jgi:hypothetical protein
MMSLPARGLTAAMGEKNYWPRLLARTIGQD